MTVATNQYQLNQYECRIIHFPNEKTAKVGAFPAERTAKIIHFPSARTEQPIKNAEISLEEETEILFALSQEPITRIGEELYHIGNVFVEDALANPEETTEKYRGLIGIVRGAENLRLGPAFNYQTGKLVSQNDVPTLRRAYGLYHQFEPCMPYTATARGPLSLQSALASLNESGYQTNLTLKDLLTYRRGQDEAVMNNKPLHQEETLRSAYLH